MFNFETAQIKGPSLFSVCSLFRHGFNNTVLGKSSFVSELFSTWAYPGYSFHTSASFARTLVFRRKIPSPAVPGWGAVQPCGAVGQASAGRWRWRLSCPARLLRGIATRTRYKQIQREHSYPWVTWWQPSAYCTERRCIKCTQGSKWRLTSKATSNPQMRTKVKHFFFFFPTFAERSRCHKTYFMSRQKWLSPALPGLYFPSWVRSYKYRVLDCSFFILAPVRLRALSVPTLLLCRFSSFTFCCLKSLLQFVFNHI